MFSVDENIKRFVDKLGITRSVYNSSKVPTSMDGVLVFPFFGDTRSSFILSSLLLKRFKEELNSSKYFILLSWPGNEGLFNYVDEYWSINDDVSLDKLRAGVQGFKNDSVYFNLFLKKLNEWFYNIFTYDDLKKYYDVGFKKDFFDEFKHIKVHFPSLHSSVYLGLETAKNLNNLNNKIFINPSKEVYGWKNGKLFTQRSSRSFWISLTDSLCSDGYTPIINKSIFTHDISLEVNRKCLNFTNLDASKLLCLIRTCGFALDVFGGFTNILMCARTPFISVDERMRFFSQKEYEIDDLCSINLQHEHIFSFSTIICNDDKSQIDYLISTIMHKVNKFYQSIDRGSTPSTAEFNEIRPYDLVRKNKNKKLGTRFIKIKE